MTRSFQLALSVEQGNLIVKIYKILCPVYLFCVKKILSKKEQTLEVIFFAVLVSKIQSKFQINMYFLIGRHFNLDCSFAH